MTTEILSLRGVGTQDFGEEDDALSEREYGPRGRPVEGDDDSNEADEHSPQGPDEEENDDSEYEEVISDDDLTKTFEKIIEKLNSVEAPSTQEQQTSFTDKYHKYLKTVLAERTSSRNNKYVGKTILHVIADARGTSTSHSWLVEDVLRKFPKLILQENRDGRTALHIAIEKGKEYFIEIVLKQGSVIDNILNAADKDEENCLHVAIHVGLRVDTTIELIQRASQQTLSARNCNGHTPLHLAVEHRRCTEEQFKIVQLLIMHGDAAFDPTGKFAGSHSVYQHHVATRPELLEDNPLARNPAKKKTQTGTDKPAAAKTNPERKVGEDKVKKTKQIEEEDKQRKDAQNDKGLPKEGKLGKGEIEKETGNRGKTGPNGPDQMEIIPTLSRTRTANFDLKSPSSQPGLDRKGKIGPNEGVLRAPSKATIGTRTPSSSKRAELPRAPRTNSTNKLARKPKEQPPYRGKQPNEASVAAIEKELKLSYLRTAFGTRTAAGVKRDHNSAVTFLHGQNQKNLHIAFEFRDCDEEITECRFRSSYASFTFDTVLQYVAFGQVNLFPRSFYPSGQESRTDGIEAYSKRGKGKEDVAILFKWLYDKGVRSIVKVIVDDLEPPSHTNEAIELALQTFEIEILDWRKYDIDPRTLCKATASGLLRELHLRWSGNNAILRAWSEPEGLALLTSLKTVYLYEKQELENDTRIEADIKEFKQRLAKHRSDIKVIPVKEDGHRRYFETSPSSNDAPNTHEAKVDPHRWLSCIDEFSDAIQNIKSNDWERHIPGIPSQQSVLKAPVKIVLIDDGASKIRQTIGDKIVSGKSFDSGYNDKDLPGGPRPYHISTSGHGTLMAEMICRVCPKVELSVFKLDVYPTGLGGKLIFTAESAAAAVDYAARGDCDIISMSWTIEEITIEIGNNTAAIKKLKTALDLAISNGKLLFCSAPDEGGFDANCYPLTHKSPHDGPGGIFRIGAAKADGIAWGSAGNVKDLDFILPGYEVREKNEEGMVPSVLKKHTGSSVATALAAGLAALLIHCVRLGALYAATMPEEKGKETTRLTEEHIKNAKKYHQMMELLKRAGSIKHKDGKYLQVWNIFDNLANDIRGATVDDSEYEKLRLEGKDGRTKKQLELIASRAYSLIFQEVGSAF